MYPYHLDISNNGFLYELGDGRFQLMNGAEPEQIMIGYGYIFVENELATTLENLDVERIKFFPAILFDRSKMKELSTHSKMVVNHHFDSDQIKDLDIVGKQFLLMSNQYLFVSPELKDILQEVVPKLTYPKGLSRFA